MQIDDTQLDIKQGYVYCLRSNLIPGYKIGITQNLEARFKQLKVGDKSTLIACWPHDGYREIEKHVHKLYCECRIPQSEYFSFTDDQIVEVLSLLNTCSAPEYIIPEFAHITCDRFPGMRMTKVQPHLVNKYAELNYFIALTLVSIAAYLLGSFT